MVQEFPTGPRMVPVLSKEKPNFPAVEIEIPDEQKFSWKWIFENYKVEKKGEEYIAVRRRR